MYATLRRPPQAGAGALDCPSPRVQWMASRLLVRKEADMVCVEQRCRGVTAVGAFRTASGRTMMRAAHTEAASTRGTTATATRTIGAPGVQDGSRSVPTDYAIHTAFVKPHNACDRGRAPRKRRRGEQLALLAIQPTT